MKTPLPRLAAASLLLLLAACDSGPGPTPGAPTAAPTAATAPTQAANLPTTAATQPGTTIPAGPTQTNPPAAPTQAGQSPTAGPPTLPAGETNAQPGPGDGQIDEGALYHMSRDPLYRNPVGPAPMGTVITLRLRAARGDLTGATLRLWDTQANGERLLPLRLERRTAEGDFWTISFQTPAKPDTFWYRFLVQDGSATASYQDDSTRDEGLGEGRAAPNDWDYLINSYDPKWTIPDWMQDAVVYQIFPDRFFNGDADNDRPAGQAVYDTTTTRAAWTDPPKGNSEFYGGDLDGIIQKLDYLQSLGVTVIYLNPIFDAASNHGYDTRDYKRIATWFGDQQTFVRLLQEMKRRNMRLILDGVFNHSGSDSLYFDAYNRYPTDGAFESQQSPYYNLYRFFKWPKLYNTFEKFDTLPAFAEDDAVRDFIFRQPNSVAQSWLRAGVAGWRLDAAKYKSDQFWRDFRTSVRGAFPDAVIIGENWENAAGWLSGDQWDGVTNYRFRAAALGFLGATPTVSAEELDNQLAALREDYPPNAVTASLNIIDSHDVERALYSVGEDKNKLRLLALLQFTSPGAPTIYYGDEAGLTGGKDPDDRRTYPWGSEDKALIEFYQALGRARHAVSALRTGSVQRLLAQNDNRVYAFARHDDKSTAVVALNAGGGEQTLDLDVRSLLADGAVLRDVLTNGTSYTVQGGHIQIKVGANWGALLVP